MSKILVMGELNADLVISGLSSLPILGREILSQGFQMTLGSSSAITAARLAALGAEVDFIGIIGDDDIGRFVLAQLKTFGVNCHLVQTVAIPTGVTIALSYPNDRALITYPGTISAYDGSGINSDLLTNYTHLHVGSFFLQTALQTNLHRIFKQANALAVTTSLDVGWDPEEQWMHNPHLAETLAAVDYFFPNEAETNALSKTSQELANKVKGLLLVKRGAQGATAYNAHEEMAHASASTVKVVDTTGAGDAFNAGFIYATCIEKQTLKTALRFAVACGSQAVTQVGGASNAPSAADINKNYIEDYPE